MFVSMYAGFYPIHCGYFCEYSLGINQIIIANAMLFFFWTDLSDLGVFIGSVKFELNLNSNQIRVFESDFFGLDKNQIKLIKFNVN